MAAGQGVRRQALSLSDIYQAYRQRFDLEHCFRFGQQKWRLDNFQTPAEGREANWWQLVPIAYAQLWLARHVAQSLPRPWERHLPLMKARPLSPSLVQRDFGRLIRQMGTPAQPPNRAVFHQAAATGRNYPCTHATQWSSKLNQWRMRPETGLIV